MTGLEVLISDEKIKAHGAGLGDSSSGWARSAPNDENLLSRATDRIRPGSRRA